MDEFDHIVGEIKDEQKDSERVALVLMFDKLPGTTEFDLAELSKGTYLQTHLLPSYVNLTVTAVMGTVAGQIEEVIQRDLNSD